MNAITEFKMCNFGCFTPNIAYETKISNKTHNECKHYLCSSETPFKERFRNHTRDFKHQTYEKSTELSKYTWTFKSHGITPIVKWSIVKRVRSRTAGNYCKLCLTEKVYMIQSLDDKFLSNKKSELVNKCGHQNQLLLRNVKRNYTMD